MSRIARFLYGLACYSVFLGMFLYAIGFIGGVLTPTQLDGVAQRAAAALSHGLSPNHSETRAASDFL